MTNPSDPVDDELLRRARRRVKLRSGLMTHALIYVLVNLGLTAIDLATGGPYRHLGAWLGWGLGLSMHGIVTLMALSGEGWRQRMLQREIERLRLQR
jgi:hypothetical protein